MGRRKKMFINTFVLCLIAVVFFRSEAATPLGNFCYEKFSLRELK